MLKDPAKLTLRMERDAIEAARRVAEKRGTSLSRIVEQHFRTLAQQEDDDEAWASELHPKTRYFLGLAEGAGVDENDYRRQLEEKHQ